MVGNKRNKSRTPEERRERKKFLQRINKKIARGTASKKEKQLYLKMTGFKDFSNIKILTKADRDIQLEKKRLNGRIKRNTASEEDKQRYMDLMGISDLKSVKTETDEQRKKRLELSVLRTHVWLNRATDEHKKRFKELTGRDTSHLKVETKAERKTRSQKARIYMKKRSATETGRRVNSLYRRIQKNLATKDEEREYEELTGNDPNKISRETPEQRQRRLDYLKERDRRRREAKRSAKRSRTADLEASVESELEEEEEESASSSSDSDSSASGSSSSSSEEDEDSDDFDDEESSSSDDDSTSEESSSSSDEESEASCNNKRPSKKQHMREVNNKRDTLPIPEEEERAVSPMPDEACSAPMPDGAPSNAHIHQNRASSETDAQHNSSCIVM